MAKFFASSSTWMLVLLLSLLVYQSACGPLCRGMLEFAGDVEDMNETLKHCSEDCSSPNITDEKCRCLNFSTSQVGQCNADYFAEGLKRLEDRWNLTSDPLNVFANLVNRIKNCKVDYSQLFQQCEANVSLPEFQRKLTSLSQMLSTLSA